MNAFLNALSSYDTQTWNGAVSHSTSGSPLLDYFGKCGSYRGRSMQEVGSDLASIFGEDQFHAMRMVLYNRMITRKCKGFVNETSVQKGQGQKDEFVKSLSWLENNQRDILKKNLWLVPEVGCWHDLWYDSPISGYYHYTDTSLVYPLIKSALDYEYHVQLLAKYLPKIRSNSNTKNDRHRRKNQWAKGLCKYLKWSEADYRKFKSDPNKVAHLWQRQMSDQDWDKIDFNTIPGRALTKMVASSKDLLTRHNLVNKFKTWLTKQSTVKFTGYPYELFMKASRKRSEVQTITYDLQFEHLLSLAKESIRPELLQKGVLCALDTSASMTWHDFGNGVQPYHICLGLGIYFASLIEGYFHNNVIQFSRESRLHKLTGNSFCGKVDQAQRIGAGGNTNFQSVIDELVRVRQSNPNIPIEDYPQILLVISDMQFDPSGSSYWGLGEIYPNMETNYEAAMRKLRAVGLPDMTIIWWHVNGQHTTDFPSKMDDQGTVLVSGFDGSIVTSILEGEEIVDEKTKKVRKATPYEQMMNALDQQILNIVKI